MSFSFWQVGDPLPVSTFSQEVALNHAVRVAQATAGWFVALSGGAVVWKGVGALYEHLNQRELVASRAQTELNYDKIEKTGNLFATYGTAGTAIALAVGFFVKQQANK